jgi:chemotaxis signal transduction protein
LPGSTSTIEILSSSGEDSSTLGSGHLVAPQGPTPSNGMHAAVEGLLLTKDDTTPSIDTCAALSNPDDPNAKMARSVMIRSNEAGLTAEATEKIVVTKVSKQTKRKHA